MFNLSFAAGGLVVGIRSWEHLKSLHSREVRAPGSIATRIQRNAFCVIFLTARQVVHVVPSGSSPHNLESCAMDVLETLLGVRQ